MVSLPQGVQDIAKRAAAAGMTTQQIAAAYQTAQQKTSTTQPKPPVKSPGTFVQPGQPVAGTSGGPTGDIAMAGNRPGGPTGAVAPTPSQPAPAPMQTVQQPKKLSVEEIISSARAQGKTDAEINDALRKVGLQPLSTATGTNTLAPKAPGTGMNLTDNITGYSESMRQEDMNRQTEMRNKMQQIIEDMRNSNSQAEQAIAANLQKRIDNVNNTNQLVQSALADLQQKANLLFDARASQAAVARAREMAAQGLITEDQISQVANYSLGDYRREVEIKKIEIEQQIQEQYMNTLKEKQQQLDGIFQDEALSIEQKRQAMQQIESVYMSALQQYTESLNNINTFYFNAITGNLQGAQQIETQSQAAIVADDISRAIDARRLQAARTDTMQRMNAVIQMAQQVDQNLMPFIMQIVNELISRGQFMSRQDVENQIAEIIAQAQSRRTAQAAKGSSSPSALQFFPVPGGQ